MRAKTVNENIGFQRGSSVKDSMDIGSVRYKDYLLSGFEYMTVDRKEILDLISRYLKLEPNKIYLLETSPDRHEAGLEAIYDLENPSGILPGTKDFTRNSGEYGKEEVRVEFFGTPLGVMAKAITYNDHDEDDIDWFGGLELRSNIPINNE